MVGDVSKRQNMFLLLAKIMNSFVQPSFQDVAVSCLSHVEQTEFADSRNILPYRRPILKKLKAWNFGNYCPIKL